MTWYSIKNVETEGVVEFEGEQDGPFAACRMRGYRESHVIGKAAFTDRREAIAAGIAKLKRARESSSRRASRIASRIAELEMMREERTP